jgi:hypothetical protein
MADAVLQVDRKFGPARYMVGVLWRAGALLAAQVHL